MLAFMYMQENHCKHKISPCCGWPSRGLVRKGQNNKFFCVWVFVFVFLWLRCRQVGGSLYSVGCFRCWQSGSTSMFLIGSKSTTTCPQPSATIAAPCCLASSDKASSVRVSMTRWYHQHHHCYENSCYYYFGAIIQHPQLHMVSFLRLCVDTMAVTKCQQGLQRTGA